MSTQNTAPAATLFPMCDAGHFPLTNEQCARLKLAGASARELRACEAVGNSDTRALLIEFFCDACPLNWQKLQRIVSLMRWKMDRHDLRPIGGDIITNAAKFHFSECEGCNDHRLFYPRALAIVCPEFLDAKILAMDDDGKANALFECGWTVPETVDWQAIKSARLGDTLP